MVTETEKSTVKAPINVCTYFTKVCYFIYQWNTGDSRTCFPWILLTYGYLSYLHSWMGHQPTANGLKSKSSKSYTQTQFCSEQVCLQKKLNVFDAFQEPYKMHSALGIVNPHVRRHLTVQHKGFHVFLHIKSVWSCHLSSRQDYK